MKYFILFLVSIINYTITYSQTGSAIIYIKDGQTLNVTISSVHEKGLVDSNGAGIPFFAIDSLITSDNSLVNRIKDFNPQFTMKLYPQLYIPQRGKNMFDKDEYKPTNISSIKYEQPYLVLLPLSFLAFGLAWDYFEDASQLSETIDAFKILKLSTDELESQKTRKSILGVTFAIVGVINALVSFQRFEIKATQNSVGLSYKF